MKRITDKKTSVKKIAEKYGLKLVMFFGSFASGKNRQDSDLDVAVLGSKEVSFQEQIDIINKFSEIFSENVDLSVLNNGNPLLLFEVSKNAKLLYGSDEEFMKFKLQAFRQYNDYAQYFEMEKRLNKKIIESYATR